MDDDDKFWHTHKLTVMPEYVQWRNSTKVLDWAMLACKHCGYTIFNHFAEASKIVEAGAISKPVIDFELTRYACYRIVQNECLRKNE